MKDIFITFQKYSDLLSYNTLHYSILQQPLFIGDQTCNKGFNYWIISEGLS